MAENLDFLRAAVQRTRLQPGAVKFDSAGADASPQASASAAANAYAERDCRLRAAAVLQQWAETNAEDLAEGETLAQRLQALLIGAVDADLDGELSEDEALVCDQLRNAAWDYLLSKAVNEEDCSLVLNDFDDAAAERVHDVFVAALPDGEEAALDELDAFAFGGNGAEEALFDAAYHQRMAFRHGQKVRIKQRISGHVRLSAKQKLAIKKAQRKSHSGVAQARRLKSLTRRKRAGL